MSGTTTVVANSVGSSASVMASASLAGATTSRSLNDWLGDAVYIEAFGGNGKGTADNSAALTAAIASGKPVRFGPGTYLLNGEFTISSSSTVVLIGSPGQTVLLGGTQTGTAWISVSAPTLFADGIIFDANTVAAQNIPGVLVMNTCTYSDWNQCTFRNAKGGAVGTAANASGVTVQNYSSTSTTQRHSFTDCEAYGNAINGINAEAISGLQVSGCRCYNNGYSGISFDYSVLGSDGAFSLYGQIVANRCWSNNMVGIRVGDFNQLNIFPSPTQPDAVYCLISNNVCYSNKEYGIVAQGAYLLTNGNICYGNGSSAGAASGGILANSSNSRITNNIVFNNYAFGIDAGGSSSVDVSDNYVSTALTPGGIGINIGGSQNCRVSGNYINGFSYYGIVIENVEANASGAPFPLPTSGIIIVNNDLYIPESAIQNFGGGILVTDGAQGVNAISNRFITPDAYGTQCILALTNGYSVSQNILNGQAFPLTYQPSNRILFQDIADGVVVPAPSSPSTAMIETIESSNAADYATFITFITVTDGGSGYTSVPTITISPPGGSGETAVATALLYNGQVIGVTLLAAGDGPGTGYTSTPTVTFSGGGKTAATATASVSGGGVSGVVVGGAGNGYTSAPTVTLNGGGGTGATATASLGLIDFVVQESGSGYTSVPTVTLSGGGGTGATATASLGVIGVGVGASGSGYTSAPTVTLSGGGGTGATATASLGVIAVAVGAHGSGYTSMPTVTLSGGGGTGATAVSSLGVIGVGVGASGSGYTSAPTVTLSGGGGTGATATASVSGGVVTGVTMVTLGSGYSLAPTVTFSGGGGSGATATASLGVVGVGLAYSGSGYTSAPTVTFSGGGGTGATATASRGVVGVVVAESGSGYSSVPTVIFGGGGGTGATAVASLGVTGVVVAGAGSGYTSAPTVSFGGGAGTGAAASAFMEVTGVNVGASGSGYSSAPTVMFSGGGFAVATAYVGLLPPANRIIKLICQATTVFDTPGSGPTQSNWTGWPITVPAGTEIDWIFSGAGWTALNFQQSDYVQPNGSGGVAFHSVSGNVALHPGGSGAVQWISDTQTTGCTTTIGSGSPQGVVTATPGSDYRNLTGTAGSIFWIKQTGTGNTGWIALA